MRRRRIARLALACGLVVVLMGLPGRVSLVRAERAESSDTPLKRRGTVFLRGGALLPLAWRGDFGHSIAAGFGYGGIEIALAASGVPGRLRIGEEDGKPQRRSVSAVGLDLRFAPAFRIALDQLWLRAGFGFGIYRAAAPRSEGFDEVATGFLFSGYGVVGLEWLWIRPSIRGPTSDRVACTVSASASISGSATLTWARPSTEHRPDTNGLIQLARAHSLSRRS